METENGFTLVEMLVGLIVLSLTAVILSGTIGDGFHSYNRIADVNDRLETERHLRKAMSTYVSSQYFDQTDAETENVQAPLVLKENNIYQVRVGEFTLFESENPLRFRHVSTYLQLEIYKDENWKILERVLKPITVEPFCRYDIVGRRCR